MCSGTIQFLHVRIDLQKAQAEQLAEIIRISKELERLIM